MADPTDQISVDLPCHVCGYDLRAHPADGKCPECEASVAESRRVAAIPRRPAWRDCDPRWRRRMLAGIWILVLLPLADALWTFGFASSIPAPRVFDFRETVHTLVDTLLFTLRVYQPVVFCIGVVLLFSKERGRRHAPLDWTRRWGVLCSYVVLLLSAAPILFISALVLTGIAALFLSIQLQYQPAVTDLFVSLSTTYLWYGPYPHDSSYAVCVAFSSIVILLACIPLFDALRSSGPKQAAASLLAPLALLSLLHLAQAGGYCFGVATSTDLGWYAVYFSPQLLVGPSAGASIPLNVWGAAFNAFFVEAFKWCIILAMAVWLTVAQLAGWRQGRMRNTA